jgi:predicted Zn-dependent peptidase
LKAELSYNLERPASLAEYLGRNSGNVSGNVEDLFRDIDAVQVHDVNAVNNQLI